MNKILTHLFAGLSVALFLPLATSAQTTFFSDTFNNGSTLNSLTPANPTTTSTAYEVVSSKLYSPNPTMSANDLQMGIAATSSGLFEVQALFATTPVALSQTGDYIQLTVVYTNFSGLLMTNGQLGFGLYNSGQIKPIPGGINNATNIYGNSVIAGTNGYTQNWQGYWSQIQYGANASRISTRPVESGYQDLVTSGTSSSQGGSAGTGLTTIGTAVTANLTNTTAGGTYTEVLTITQHAVNSLTITNTIYLGAGTGGTVVTNFGGIATNTTYLTGSFDGLAIGYCGRAAGFSNTMSIASIQVSGSVTAASGPPLITTQPVPVTVANNGACDFNVAANGLNVTYQWYRNNAALTDGGNISGSTSAMLVITNAGAGDAFSGANGYYCVVSGTGNFSTNSVTNSLSLISPTTLYYAGSGPWDLNNSDSWNTDDAMDQSLPFNFGDPVVFDDGGAGGVVTLTGNYLSASSVTINEQSVTFPYTFKGTGSIAGPGSLNYIGSTKFTISNTNTYTGGTMISNSSAYLTFGSANALGTGPVILGMAGGTMEWTVSASASSGVGNVIVADDFNMKFDVASTFSGVFQGDLSGTSGKTLTLTANTSVAPTNERVRVYGTNTTCNANITFNAGGNTNISLAPYNTAGTQTYNGVISGDGSVWQRGNGASIFNNQNTYSGGTYATGGSLGLGSNTSSNSGVLASGPIGIGPLYISPETGSGSGSGTVLASGGAWTIANPLQYPTNNQVLIVGGTNALTFSGAYTLNGADGLVTNRIFQVNNTNAAVTISGTISDNGTGCGFIKTGSGNLYLDGVTTYTGPTTNSSSALTNGLGVLAGTGTIGGNVVILTNSAIGGGDASGIGTLNIGGTLAIINGNGWFRVNRSGLQSDKVSVSGTLSSGGIGTIAITNIGTTLQIGDRFVLFNKAVTGGGSMLVTGGNVNWTNNLAVDGSVTVVAPADAGVTATGPGSTSVGSAVAYTVTVTNIGPGLATSIQATYGFPTNFTFVSASGSGTTNTARLIAWPAFNLVANTATNFTVNLMATGGGTATNVATVSSTSYDPSSVNNTATNVTTIATTIIPNVPPKIAGFSLSGGNIIINATNGVTGGVYYLLQTTNIAKPLNQWISVGTNVISASGGNNAFSFIGTNVVTPASGHQFYILSSTNN